MVTQQILDYINKERSKGMSDDVIHEVLLKGNWSEQDIAQAFENVKHGIPAPSVLPTNPMQLDSSTTTIIVILLLVFVYPVGLLLMWFWTKWPKWMKVVLSAPIFLAILGIFAAILLATVNPTAQIQKAAKTRCDQVCANSQNASCISTCMSQYK